MKNRIIFKRSLAENLKKIIVHAPQVARKVLPGQFVVVMVDKKGERIPLTVVESSRKKGTITLIFQEVGKTTVRLGQLKPGQCLRSLLGPLGKPAQIKRWGTVLTIGGGVGIAEVYPLSKAFQTAGNKVIALIGARTKGLLILEDQMRRVSDELYITTDDGSYARQGRVSDVLKELLSKRKIDLVYAVGPLPMMEKVTQLTRPFAITTLVSLNPIMVDATGMCGACRVSVGGGTRFACVEGPEFDAHQVDFSQLRQRLGLFQEQERKAMEEVEKDARADA